jgi:membrane protein DedA with SNARE-associated domain
MGSHSRAVLAPPQPAGHRSRTRRILTWLAGLAGTVAIVVVLWNQGERLINGQASGWSCYLITVALVFGDAVCPVLPGETTLNAACVLAANGKLNLLLVVISGAIGAIAGDSTVYWLSRSARGRVRNWLNRAASAKAGTTVVRLLNEHGSVFILFGRYVPGVRFALNVALGGVARMPYGSFVIWSSLSGTLWSVWTCLSAYYISTALAGYPLAALIVSCLAGSVLIGTVIWVHARITRRYAPVPAGSEQFELTGAQHRFAATAGGQLAIDGGQVGLHRIDRQV